jgi:hypothetical protein
MRAIWTPPNLQLATASGNADSGDPAPATNELAGAQALDCDLRKITCQTFASARAKTTTRAVLKTLSATPESVTLLA